MLVLKRVRECDGACCKESPRWPNIYGDDCIYRDPTKPGRGCMITAGLFPPPDACSAVTGCTGAEAHKETCVDWPANTEPRIGETGACCWKWVDDGN